MTDLPSSFPTTCEWNVICIGDAQRTTAVITIYTGGSNKNGWTYKANIFNGAIIRDWHSLDEDLNSKTSYSNSDITDVHSSIELQTSRIDRKAGICSVSIAFKTTASINGYVKLFKLPIYPAGERNWIATSLAGTSIPMYISSAGDAYGRNNIPASEWIESNFTFME